MTRNIARNEVGEVQQGRARWEDELKEMFGSIPPHDIVGLYCLVHTDSPSPGIRRNRVKTFRPDHYFDCHCDMCQIFLDQGSIMIFDRHDVTALRRGPGNTIEMVSFNTTTKAAPSN